MKLCMDVLTPGLTWADIEHEREIARAAMGIAGGHTPDQRKRAADRHRALIAERSDAAVEAMERAQGLAHV